jgi:hypothetical protein
VAGAAAFALLQLKFENFLKPVRKNPLGTRAETLTARVTTLLLASSKGPYTPRRRQPRRCGNLSGMSRNAWIVIAVVVVIIVILFATGVLGGGDGAFGY